MIKIQIAKGLKLKNTQDSAFIKFPFDTYLVSVMREQSIRVWHADKKMWEIPAKNLNEFLEMIEDREVEIKGQVEVKEEKKIDYSFKTKPFEHQIEGFEFGMNVDSFLLGDQQGLGKTKQVIDIAVAKKEKYGYKHCLIICGVNGLKWNWKNEVETHSNETAHILGYKGNINISSKDKINSLENLPFDYFLITNLESLRKEEIVNKIKHLIDTKEIGMIIVDEIHKAKNPTRQQGKGLLKLKAESQIAMTGTPLMNSPLDLYVSLKWLGYENHSYYQFKNHYCQMGGFGGHEVVGYKNLNQIQKLLDMMMLRRLKKDVLDLPEKIYQTEYVEMSNKQTKIYNEILEDLKKNIDKVKLSNNPLAQLIRLRQATADTSILSSSIKESAKLDRLEELVEELVENNQKVIVFSNWTNVTDGAIKRLSKYNPAVITGETKDRETEKNKFMNDSNCKVIIGTIGAMGTGLTLTETNTVIFLDSPWTKADKEQAEDRAHRIGTKSTVNIITLVCKDTIDERIEQLIEKKGKMANLLIDKEFELSKGEIVDFLLN